MNTARCALSTLIILPNGHTVGTHPLISRFVKGVFVQRPPTPRYTEVWDVRILLNYLRSLTPMRWLGLKDLTLKVCMLIALLSAQRCQTLHLLNIKNMTIKGSKIIFRVNELIKQSRPGHCGTTIELKAYPPDRRLCIFKLLLLYLKTTKKLRGKETQLFISYRKPYAKVSKDTIARWLRTTMTEAGINTSRFKPHSVRAAATSAAGEKQVPIVDILQTAGWSRERTFRTYYQKPVVKDNKFADAILNLSKD